MFFSVSFNRKYEWHKHGTCAARAESLNSQHKYFGKALELYHKMDLDGYRTFSCAHTVLCIHTLLLCFLVASIFLMFLIPDNSQAYLPLTVQFTESDYCFVLVFICHLKKSINTSKNLKCKSVSVTVAS